MPVSHLITLIQASSQFDCVMRWSSVFRWFDECTASGFLIWLDTWWHSWGGQLKQVVITSVWPFILLINNSTVPKPPGVSIDQYRIDCPAILMQRHSLGLVCEGKFNRLEFSSIWKATFFFSLAAFIRLIAISWLYQKKWRHICEVLLVILQARRQAGLSLWKLLSS